MQKFPQRGNYKILKKKTELSEGESSVVGCNEPNKVKVRLEGAGETEKVLMNPSQADYPSTAAGDTGLGPSSQATMQGTSHSTDFLPASSYLVLVDFPTAYFPVLCPCLPPGSPPNTVFNPVFILKIALWRIDYRGQVSGEARDQWGVFLSVSRRDSVTRWGAE